MATFGWVLCGLSAPAAWAGTVKASSEATGPDKTRHTAALAFDGELQTAWAESDMGSGEGAWIELKLDRPTEIHTVSLWGGDLRKGDRSARESPRPKLVTVTLETANGPVTVQDALPDVVDKGIARKDIKIEGVATSVRITIDEVFGGFITNDCFLAEVAINFHEREGGPVGLIREWMASPAGQKLSTSHRDEVIKIFDQIDTAEFGDRDALQRLIDWAANGAPWVQEKAKREVPYGWRVQAIPPDDVAVEALLKLKDANAIPGLTMAALRLSGRDQKALLSKVAYFEAWSELNGGPRRNLPTWGDPGWEKGAIQGFEEPLAVGQGVYGDLYIADVANHRVSIFTPEGTTRAVWGVGKPNVTETWFDGERRYYVAGSEPSKAEGGFTNPVDLVVLPGKESDEVVVLDALGRVQWFDASGQVTKSWKVSPTKPIQGGVGGAGHLVSVKEKWVIVANDEVFVFDDEGTELARWEIEEGEPIAVEALSNGKLLLGFRREAVMYSLDGFRHGVEIASTDLPRGFESYDLATDEKKKLWAVTDNGWAVKFKKPGKTDFRVRWTKIDVDVPRFAVHDGMLYIVAEGKIRQVDALELRAEADAEAEAEPAP